VVPGCKTGGEQTIVAFLYSTCEGILWVDDFSVETVDVNAMAEAPDEPAAGPKTARPIVEPKDSIGYRVRVVSPLEKVFREDDFAPASRPKVEVAAARNEFESIQVVIEAPWRPVAVNEIRLSDLRGPGGAVIPSTALKWDRVEYVETLVRPAYFAERGLGWYPDPLMPASGFTVEKLSRTPVWITLKTPKDCAAGSAPFNRAAARSPDKVKIAALFMRCQRGEYRRALWLSRYPGLSGGKRCARIPETRTSCEHCEQIVIRNSGA
jgi:hypothetical protein